VKADSCYESPTFGQLYAKQYFQSEFRYNIIPRDTFANKDTVLDFTIADILTIYPETITGFQEIIQKFGNFWFLDFYPGVADTTTEYLRNLSYRFENYVNIDSVQRYIKNIPNVIYCGYLRRYGAEDGIKETFNVTFNNIIISPQPANDKINIKNLNADDFKEKNIKLVNVLGIVVNSYKFNTPEFQIDVSDLPNGMYNLISNNIVKPFIVLR